ncbi:MAG TPA: glycosyltransferase family 2 protein [Steroidobacteraceae bacterium]|nr:glycosyltransferase family 2 protein [Steroidobacteraceae bacterium]
MVQSSHREPPVLDEYTRQVADLRCPLGGRSLLRGAPLAPDGLVTVITVAFNSAGTISRTIDSIAAQTHPRIEYIIVDGASSDGTVELLRQREADIDLWLSEPDRGISDAFNKGIALASGQFISLVNSDDWMDPDHLARAIACLQESGADFAFGNLMVHGGGNAPQYVIDGNPHYATRIRHSMPALSHPSVVCRREVYERHGLYDRNLRIAMDYEWLLRSYKSGARGRYVPQITSHMGGGGVSDLSGHVGLREVRDVSIRHGYSSPLAWTRYWARVSRLRARLLMERWGLSRRVAQRLRRLIHPAYRPYASREN